MYISMHMYMYMYMCVVEWWFGDSAKSLLMLPKSYFGFFDLVVVDLSETVMSFSGHGSTEYVSNTVIIITTRGDYVKE